LILGCEQAKRRLSRMNKTSIRLQAAGFEHVMELSRQEFEAMTSHLLQTTKLTTEMTLEDAGLAWKQIDRVVLVGGSTHMPMVREMLKTISGKEPDTGVNPVLAVALGAAGYAQMLELGKGPKAIHRKSDAPDRPLLKPDDEETLSPIRLLPDDAFDDEVDEVKEPVFDEPALDATGEFDDPFSRDVAAFSAQRQAKVAVPKVSFVTAHGVGIRALRDGRMSNVVLIHKNTRVPVSVSREFRTVGIDGTRKVRRITIAVTQGDTEHLDLAEELGEGRIEGLPPNTPPGQPVRVTMSFDDQGRLHVHAIFVPTGHDLKMSLNIPGSLAEHEVQQYRDLFASSGLIPQAKAGPIARMLENIDDDDDDVPFLEPLN
jgi:molecular chaperone DnaK